MLYADTAAVRAVEARWAFTVRAEKVHYVRKPQRELSSRDSMASGSSIRDEPPGFCSEAGAA